LRQWKAEPSKAPTERRLLPLRPIARLAYVRLTDLEPNRYECRTNTIYRPANATSPVACRNRIYRHVQLQLFQEIAGHEESGTRGRPGCRCAYSCGTYCAGGSNASDTHDEADARYPAARDDALFPAQALERFRALEARSEAGDRLEVTEHTP
jgi:hypothetical protein